jgi:hypothetical protein
MIVLLNWRQLSCLTQGLSDWFEPELWPTGEALTNSCNLYYFVPEERVLAGKRYGACVLKQQYSTHGVFFGTLAKTVYAFQH